MAGARCCACGIPLTSDERVGPCCPSCGNHLGQGESLAEAESVSSRAVPERTQGWCDLCDDLTESRADIYLCIASTDREGAYRIRRWFTVRASCCPQCLGKIYRFQRSFWIVGLILLLAIPAMFGGWDLANRLFPQTIVVGYVGIFLAPILMFWMADLYQGFEFRRFTRAIAPEAAAVVKSLRGRIGGLLVRFKVQSKPPSGETFITFDEARKELVRQNR